MGALCTATFYLFIYLCMYVIVGLFSHVVNEYILG